MEIHQLLEAYKFGLNLQSTYVKRHQAIRSGKSDEEVYHFRALIEALNNDGDCFAKEVHGRGHIVGFVPAGKWGNRCEIADIALISFCSKPKSEIRLSFVQAKLVRGPMNPRRLGVALHQWDLLSRRPVLKELIGRSCRSFPKDILSAAVLPSIGSFLFFHEREPCLYLPADLLKMNPSKSKSKSKSNYGTVRISKFCWPGILRRKNGYAEVKRTDHIHFFGIAAKCMLIGSPVLIGREVIQPDAVSLVRHLLSELREAGEGENPMVAEALELAQKVEIDPHFAFEAGKFGAKAVVVIKGQKLPELDLSHFYEW